MSRRLIALPLAGLLGMAVAGPVFAAHCVNESKPDGAGQHLVVLLDPTTFAPTFLGANAAGRFTGGFADIYLDLVSPGTLTPGDLLLDSDVFLIANHSFRPNPGQSGPGGLSILPIILGGADPAGPGKGVGGGG